MTDIPEMIRLKYAIQSIRKRTLADLEAVEALIDLQIPAEGPRPGPRLPGSTAGRKRYYQDKRKRNGIGGANES